MAIQLLDGGNCMLSYGLSSTPDPIGASPGVATLSIVMSNPETVTIYCASIEVVCQTGPDALDLTEQPGTIGTVTNNGWSCDASNGTFRFTPPNAPAAIGKDGLLFQLTGIAVNKQVGITTIIINEESSYQVEPMTARSNQYSVPKFPYEWYMTDFALEDPSTVVTCGDRAKLAWKASQEGTFTIFSFGHPPEDVSGRATFQSRPLSFDTTFILQGAIQAGGETVNHYLTTTVNVWLPKLDATSLFVQDHIGVTGELEAYSATVTGNLEAASASVTGTLGAASADITGNLEAATATVTGSLGAASADITGNLTTGSATVTGNLDAGGVTVNGGLTVKSDLIVGGILTAGAVQVLGQPVALDPAYAHHAMATDGFLIGSIGGTTPNDAASGYIVASYDTPGPTPVEVIATGNAIAIGNPGASSSSFLLPVPANQGFYCGLVADARGMTATFWFVPCSVNTGLDSAAAAESHAPPIGPDDRWARLADVLEEITGEPLTAGQRGRLLGLVRPDL